MGAGVTRLAEDIGLGKAIVSRTLDAWESRKGIDVEGLNISTDNMTRIARVAKKDECTSKIAPGREARI